MSRLAVGVALAALVFAGQALADELPDVSAYVPWEVRQRNDDPDAGFTIFARRDPGTRYSSFKLEAVIDAPPALALRAALEDIADPPPKKGIDAFLVRRDGANLVTYHYLHLPLVSDRDLTIRVQHSHDPASGVYGIDWSATDEEGPAPKPGVVRIHEAGGYWRFKPFGEGRTFAVYESHTELGGSIPGWLVDSFISRSIVEQIDNLRGRIESVRRSEAAPVAGRKAPSSAGATGASGGSSRPEA